MVLFGCLIIFGDRVSEGRGVLEEGRDIHDQVREILSGDDGEQQPPSTAEGEKPPSFRIKAKLIEWGGGRKFPDKWPSALKYLTLNLCDLFDEFGQDEVLKAVDDLMAELEEHGIEKPEYYRRDIPDSKINRAIDYYPRHVEHVKQLDAERAAREAEEKKRRDFLSRYDQ